MAIVDYTMARAGANASGSYLVIQNDTVPANSLVIADVPGSANAIRVRDALNATLAA